MKHVYTALALVLMAGGPLTAVEAQAGPALDEVLQPKCTRTVCTVRGNEGGEIAVFQRAAQELLKEGKRLVVDGRCASACVILADIARANTCITPRAEMAVHQSIVLRFTGKQIVDGREQPIGELVRRENPPHSPDIDKWVKGHGGYPTEGVLVIPVAEARKFWSAC